MLFRSRLSDWGFRGQGDGLAPAKAADLIATEEVIGDAHFEEERRQAVGEIDGLNGNVVDDLGAAHATRKPVLILPGRANANAAGEGDVHASAEDGNVVAGRGSVLIEIGGEVEGASPSRRPKKGRVTAVVAVVTYAVLKSRLFGRRVFLDRGGVIVELSSPMGSNVGQAEDAIAYVMLRRVIGVAVNEGHARLKINGASRARYVLSESKRGARSQHSQDEDNSFQWKASIGRGLGLLSTSV